MPALSKKAEQVIAEIERAFRGVELGDGVSLRETEVIDMYGNEEQRRAARALDELNDWKSVVEDPALRELGGVGGPSFMDAQGLRFHLPAYMVLAVKGPWAAVNDSVMFQLTHLEDHSRKRLTILTPAQRHAVRSFLVYCRDETDQFSNWEPELTRAIDGFWNSDDDGRQVAREL